MFILCMKEFERSVSSNDVAAGGRWPFVVDLFDDENYPVKRASAARQMKPSPGGLGPWRCVSFLYPNKRNPKLEEQIEYPGQANHEPVWRSLSRLATRAKRASGPPALVSAAFAVPKPAFEPRTFSNRHYVLSVGTLRRVRF
ncbi:hypothetical protein PVAR5_4798 [Paecilomyces variotii No. 5]|uniref:Uncharacterized protein n=1 Tax=Byssochlamys spectabilis (strain No. 5 / NBRC 109023) TaxID=1356009 RepID=V5FF46_BYSSN|nr:hypothetical protein PVAR5_4798 [Paecilomyces variotii No. 5]